MYLGIHTGAGRLYAQGLQLPAAIGYACPAWAQLPDTAPEGAATITQLTGRVDVMRDSTRWALSEGEWVRPGQMVMTGPDGWAMFKLADNSTFELFPNSQVSFRANRSNLQDLLEVLLGNI